jgi:hypothetical protein
MKNYRIAFLMLTVLLCEVLPAQQIQITILPASEYTLARRDEWKVLVNNTTNQTLKVFFYGISTEAQRGKVYEARSKDREIVPGTTSFGTHYYVGLEPFTTLYEDQALRQYAIQTNGLPAGDYEICIYAYSALDSSELGSSCYNFSADYFTPPILVSPDNSDTVCEQYPFFTWLPPVPNNGQQFTYTLSLYELQNMQTIFSSVQTNQPYYEKKGITTPISQYGINARNLRPGYRYAWKVSAEVNNQTVATSEVWSFVYCKTNSLVFGVDSTKKEKPTKKNEALPGIPYMELKTQTGSNYSVMDKGKLNFQYNNRYEQKQIGYRILDSRMQLVHNEVLDVNYGLNYFSLDMKANGKLASGKLYEVQVTDPKGNILKARFKYLQ